MKKIEFINVKSKYKNYKLLKGTEYNFDSCKKIIESKLNEGYNYEGFIPHITKGNGETESIYLIFVREENGDE